jgi:hypothetical protein
MEYISQVVKDDMKVRNSVTYCVLGPSVQILLKDRKEIRKKGIQNGGKEKGKISDKKKEKRA